MKNTKLEKLSHETTPPMLTMTLMDRECRFESSQLMASLLAATPLPLDAWRLCNLANTKAPGRFLVDRVGDVAYVAFSGVQTVSGWDLSSNTAPVPITTGNNLFSALAGEAQAPMVYPGFLRLFLSIYNSPNFQNEIMATLINNKAVAFVGHSLGGAVASLATLAFLSSYPSLCSTHSLLCITFGSPLLGDEALSSAVLKQKLAHRFCHFVSTGDPVPCLLLSPASTHLNRLLTYWHSRMQMPHLHLICNNPTNGTFEPEIAELCQFISSFVTIDLNSERLYRPFGNYVFCSKEGAILLDNLTAVVQLLHYLMTGSASAASIVDDHLAYADLVPNISQQFLRRGRILESTLSSSYETGISLALEALGLKPEGKALAAAATRECLMTATQMGQRPSLKSAELAIGLAKVTPNRAQIEWYKAFCDDEGASYYDSFRQRSNPKREAAVNMARHKLGQFWDRVLHMIDSNQLPHDFQSRAKFVNASQFYMLLVEPLDIADYYRTGKHRTHGHYLARGRPRRYQVFETWWKQRNVGDGRNEGRKRRTLAGLTQDSCFWARVEEAKEWAKSARTEKDEQLLAGLWEKMEKFEAYAEGLVHRKEVSKDVLAEESSYVMWLRDFDEVRTEKNSMSG